MLQKKQGIEIMGESLGVREGLNLQTTLTLHSFVINSVVTFANDFLSNENRSKSEAISTLVIVNYFPITIVSYELRFSFILLELDIRSNRS
jgi:hypothetical protein